MQLNRSYYRNAAKTRENRLHVLPSRGGWILKNEGTKRGFKRYETESEAISAAEALREQYALIVIHSQNGRIEELS